MKKNKIISAIIILTLYLSGLFAFSRVKPEASDKEKIKRFFARNRVHNWNDYTTGKSDKTLSVRAGADAYFDNQGYLTKLELENTELTKIVLKSFEKLETLSLPDSLAFLNLSGLPELTGIRILHNDNLAVVNISGNKKFRRLDLSYCAVKTLNLSDLPDLAEIEIDWNRQLREVKLDDFPKLKTLYLPFCDIKNLILSRLPELEEINLSGNRNLSSVDLGGIAKLKKLDCYYCGINNLDVIKLPNSLTNLCLSANGGQHQIDLRGFPELEKLDLSYCFIAELKLYGLPELTDINLTGNDSLIEIDLREFPKLEKLLFTKDRCNLKKVLLHKLNKAYSRVTKIEYTRDDEGMYIIQDFSYEDESHQQGYPADEFAERQAKEYVAAKIQMGKSHIDIPADVKTEMEQLYSLESGDRAVGAFRLGNMGEAAAPAARLLTSILNDSATILIDDAGTPKFISVRQLAETALLKIGTPALEPLINALKDKDWDIRVAAALTLGKLNDNRAVMPLISALQGAYEIFRRNAAWALGEIKDIRAVGALVESLKDEHYVVRNAAAKALVKIGDPSVGPLIAALFNENPYMRMDAAGALEELHWVPENDSQKIAYFIASRQWKECVKMGTSAVEPLLCALKAKQAYIRLEAAAALGEVKDTRQVDDLIAALNDEYLGVRENAAEALGKIKDKKAVKPLIISLKDKEKKVREKAVIALGEIKDEQSTLPLIDVLQNDAEPAVQSYAAEVLGKIKDKRAVVPLIEALEKFPGLKIKAAKALGEIKDISAIKPLIRILDDKDIFVVYGACDALNQIGKPAVAHLIDALKIENIKISGMVAIILKEITNQDFGEDYESWSRWWNQNNK